MLCINTDMVWMAIKAHVEKYEDQGQLNSLKVVGAQLTNKTHFYCEKLNSYEHL